MVKLSLVIPCCNEEAAIPVFLARIDEILSPCGDIVPELVFVNDGSTDGTLEILLASAGRRKDVIVVDLSRNFGKEAAMTAGLREASGDVVVPIDVDLQDPPELVLEMLALWREGFEVVLAHRSRRDSDGFWKRVTAKWFYRVHNAFADQKIPENVGDFRLMDRKVVDAVNAMTESCRFMKGIFSWVGFRTACVHYERPERSAGEGKFNFRRLWNFALDGITGFSTIPLRMWTYFGFAVSLASFLYALVILFRVLIRGVDVPGYASLFVAIVFFGGVQLIGIGILGEYLGRNYMETKRRPIYIVRKVHAPGRDGDAGRK